VNDTEQRAAPPLPLNVHWPPWPTFADAPLENLIVPVGVVAVPGPASLTVAVHVVSCPGVTAVGEQPTNVDVSWTVITLATPRATALAPPASRTTMVVW
jgi:hypothetical protein